MDKVKRTNLDRIKEDFYKNCSTCPGTGDRCEDCRRNFKEWLDRPVCQDDYEYLNSLA